MSAKYLNGANDLFLNALTIGFTLYTVICIGGGISGGCFNPAVGIAQIAFQNIISDDPSQKVGDGWWVYPLATWIGGAIAGIFKHMNLAA